MSIVEKVVNRHVERGEVKPSQANEPKQTARTPLAEAELAADRSNIFAAVKGVVESEPESFANNPSLMQDFKFLKRPLLAQLFKPSNHGKSGHVVLVTSDLPGAGKSFVSLNLAVSIAQEQLTEVILIDADPLRRNLTVALGLEEQAGLLETLVDCNSHPADFVIPSDIPSLHFIPAGQSSQRSASPPRPARRGIVCRSPRLHPSGRAGSGRGRLGAEGPHRRAPVPSRRDRA